MTEKGIRICLPMRQARILIVFVIANEPSTIPSSPTLFVAAISDTMHCISGAMSFSPTGKKPGIHENPCFRPSLSTHTQKIMAELTAMVLRIVSTYLP